MENNSLEQIKIRKYRSILRSIGAGIIVFSVWTVAKSAGTTLLNPDESFQAGAVIFLAADLLMRIYVGRSAIAVGNGQKRSGRYIRLAVLMLACSAFILTVAGYIVIHPERGADTNGLLTSVFIEITSAALVAEMIAVSVKLRRAERREAGK